MSSRTSPIVEYRCPGERGSISRPVHLGRLARFYPACRQCEYREDTGGLSMRQVRQLAETRPRGAAGSLFHEEGASGVYLNELTPAAARRIAAAFAVCLLATRPTLHAENPVLVIAGDGRAATAELTAAVGEGIRWAGCDLLDIGPATAPCLAVAIDHFQARGGIHVGQTSQPGKNGGVGLKFFASSSPLSAGDLLDAIEQAYYAGVDRPSRTYGASRRFQAGEVYLAALAPHYHALRPLRVVLDSDSAPLTQYWRRLMEPVACQVVPFRSTPRRFREQVVTEGAHFAARVEDHGEVCRLFDERGRPVPPERLLLLLACDLHGCRHPAEGLSENGDKHPGSCGTTTSDLHHPGASPRFPTASECQHDSEGMYRATRGFTVVLEASASPALARQLEFSGVRVVHSGARRAEMDHAMRESAAVLGGGPSGRIWHAAGELPLADALRTLTLLLVLLSRNDRALSVVLDEEAPLD